MPLKDLESKLRRWDDPLSDSEESVCQTAIRTIKRIIDNCESLKSRDIVVFEQGSHANKTNVRNNSDVDIAVVCGQTFYSAVPPNRKKSDYGIISSDYSYNQYKHEVFDALAKHFNIGEVNYGQKSLKIEHFKYNNSYINIDVVPFFRFREYGQRDVRHLGVSLLTPSGEQIINYPEQHIRNSMDKNARTNHYYKRMVRCFKSLKYELEETHSNVSAVKSFVLESILYNLDDDVYDMEKTLKSVAGHNLEPYSAMFWNCIQKAKKLLTEQPDSLYEPNEILKLFDDKTRNRQTYICFLGLLEHYCF